MAFDIKKYIIENISTQHKRILNEAGTISDNDRKILKVMDLVAKIRMTQRDRELLYSILRKIRLRSGGE